MSDISLAPFRERFEQMDAAERTKPQGPFPKDAANTIAARLGWYCHDRPDGPRVRRVLGLRPGPPTLRWANGGPKYYPPRIQVSVTYETAYRLCEAMDLDPVEVGL